MKTFKNLLFASLCGFAVLVSSCGEDGIDGINGTDGVDGIDGQDGADLTIGALTASKTPNFLTVSSEFSSVEVSTILSSEDVIPSTPNFVYGSMADGAALLAEADGTFTLINNIEADYSIARIGLNSNLQPTYGEYILNAEATAATAQCSGSLITVEEHGFGPLYLSGGEWGGDSKGVFVTNPYKYATDAGTAELLTAFGQWSTENAVVIGKEAYANKTVAFIGDDHSDNDLPQGHLGMYVGDQGDLYNGSLYVLKVTSAGITYEVDMTEGVEYEAEFVKMEETELNALNQEAIDAGAMGFSRLEDVDWRRGDAATQREIYFAVTGRARTSLEGKGTQNGRVYKVVLNDTDPTGACKITCVLDGDVVGGKAEGFHSPDNILVTENYAYIQEDPNGQLDTSVNGFAKLYQYNLNDGTLKTVLECNQTAAAALGYGSTDTTWELTGMIDVTDIVDNGENTFLLMTQNHGWTPVQGTYTDANAIDPATHWATEGSTLFLVKGLDR